MNSGFVAMASSSGEHHAVTERSANAGWRAVLAMLPEIEVTGARGRVRGGRRRASVRGRYGERDAVGDGVVVMWMERMR